MADGQNAQKDHLCVAELVFGIREVERKDGGGKIPFQKATATNYAGF